MIKIKGMVNTIRIYRSARKKRLMAFVEIQSGHKKFEAVIFPQAFTKVSNWLKTGQIVSVKGLWQITERTSLFYTQSMNLESEVNCNEEKQC